MKTLARIFKKQISYITYYILNRATVVICNLLYFQSNLSNPVIVKSTNRSELNHVTKNGWINSAHFNPTFLKWFTYMACKKLYMIGLHNNYDLAHII